MGHSLEALLHWRALLLLLLGSFQHPREGAQVGPCCCCCWPDVLSPGAAGGMLLIAHAARCLLLGCASTGPVSAVDKALEDCRANSWT